MVRNCEMCPEDKVKPAAVFCSADECFLCSTCDDLVHSANRLARRHIRRPVLADDNADGSSINEDSELGLVPDVAELPHNQSSDLTSSDETLLLPLPTQVPVSFEDAAEYDFCDFSEDGLDSKMPALCAIDDDALFGETKNVGKSFYSDISWESVVPENIEHVVPDVSESTSVRVSSSTGFLKREAMEVDVKSNVVSSASSSDSSKSKDKKRVAAGRAAANSDDEETFVKKEETSESSKEDTLTGKKRALEDSDEETSDSDSKSEADAEKERLERTAEQRKKRRMEALARFRSKRANRSFTKKVRYECRKQLADSRPRVKGRFVRKVEMALYRKYGALYREHLDELKQPAAALKAEAEAVDRDQCVPAI